MEFAIIGTLLMVVVFGIIEFGRALFVMNALTEATRRGARMAVVCPVGDPKPASTAVFDNGAGSSAVVSGLTTGNVQVEYLDTAGGVIAAPAASFSSIRCEGEHRGVHTDPAYPIACGIHPHVGFP